MNLRTARDEHPAESHQAPATSVAYEEDLDRRICALYNRLLASGRKGTDIRQEWGIASAEDVLNKYVA